MRKQTPDQLGKELWEAAKKGEVQQAGTLLDSKANIHYQWYGMTPLHIASRSGKLEVVKVLLARKADPNMPEEDGYSALHSASNSGHQSVVELLLNSNANINLQDDDGWTPLHRASHKGNAAVVEVLVARNADPTIKDKDGKTARDQAVETGKPDVVKLLDDFQELEAAKAEAKAAKEETTAAREETKAAREETKAAREETKAAKEAAREETKTAKEAANKVIEAATAEAQAAKEEVKAARYEATAARAEAKAAQEEAKRAREETKAAQEEAKRAREETKAAQEMIQGEREVAVKNAREAARSAEATAQGVLAECESAKFREGEVRRALEKSEKENERLRQILNNRDPAMYVNVPSDRDTLGGLSASSSQIRIARVYLAAAREVINYMEMDGLKLSLRELSDLKTAVLLNIEQFCLWIRMKGKLHQPVRDGTKKAPLIMKKSDIEFQERLGSGSSGTVWKVQYKEQLYAFKELVKSKAKPTQDQARKELKAWSDIPRIPHLAPLVGVVMEAQEVWGFMTRLCEPGSLEGRNRLYKVDVLKAVNHALIGLRHLHKAELVHRDLALRNLLWDGTQVRVCDFGLTRPSNYTYIRNKNSEQQQLPCFAYAPEVHAASEASIDPIFTREVDVWSFGLLMWELATWETPFAAERTAMNNDDALLASIGRGETRLSLQQVAGEIPELVAPIMGCTQLKPEDRLTLEQLHLMLMGPEHMLDIRLS